MAEYIEREAAKDAVKEQLGTLDLFESRFAARIDAIPASDVEPVRHGRWIKKENIMYHGTLNENVCWTSFVCSECTGEVVLQYPGCPYCRAKMDEK